VAEEQKATYTWRCPNCYYEMTDLAIRSVIADLGCPRCKTPLSRFEPIPRFREPINPATVGTDIGDLDAELDREQPPESVKVDASALPEVQNLDSRQNSERMNPVLTLGEQLGRLGRKVASIGKGAVKVVADGARIVGFLETWGPLTGIVVIVILVLLLALKLL